MRIWFSHLKLLFPRFSYQPQTKLYRCSQLNDLLYTYWSSRALHANSLSRISCSGTNSTQLGTVGSPSLGNKSHHGPCGRSKPRSCTSRNKVYRAFTTCHRNALRSMATTVFPGRRIAQSSSLPFHLQYVLQRALERAKIDRHLLYGVS